MPARLWKFYCMEDNYPGLWLRWLKNQCVAVGWPPEAGYHLANDTKRSDGWIACRNALTRISAGDFVVVSMARSRVGRIGQVTGLCIRDSQWDPLVPASREIPTGEMGRRVLVRWDLSVGPPDFDFVVKLPEQVRFRGRGLRATVAEVASPSITDLVEVMSSPANWIGLAGKFAYEKALSDFIASYPHRLEEGLAAYPNSIIREKVFRDRTRLDVLLLDKRGSPVIVECKQHSPTISDIKQLEKYMEHVRDETGRTTRGILVHAGTPKLHKDVSKYISNTRIEIVSYTLGIDFRKSA